MKKKFNFLVVGLLLLALCSCGKDSNEPENLPPSKPEQITVTVLPNSATATISWEAATDPDGQEVLYQVTINDNILEKTWEQTSLVVDLESFTNTSKGLSVVLDISIKAYDSEGAYSTGKLTKTVTVDRSPSGFDFDEIVFDTNTYNSMAVSWKAASDPDGDELFYTVYLNEIVLAENSTIPDGQSIGTVNYEEDFSALVSDPITIRVVVTDGGTEPIEISRTFDFGATDNVLGLLNAPYSETLEYQITTDEPDGKIKFTFTLEDAVGYSLNANGGGMVTLWNSQGESVGDGSDQMGVLSPGSYGIEIKNQTTAMVDGTMVLTMVGPQETDVDLGTLQLPHSAEYGIEIGAMEVDNEVIYSLVIEEEADYLLSQEGDLALSLEDASGNVIVNDSEALAPGAYRIRVSGEMGTIALELFEPAANSNNLDLGILALPFDRAFTTAETLPNDTQSISFELAEEADFAIRINYNPSNYSYVFYDRDGMEITTPPLEAAYGALYWEDLAPGKYRIEATVYPSFLVELPGKFELKAGDFKASDQYLGVLEDPIQLNLSYESGLDPDMEARYYFTIDRATGTYLHFAGRLEPGGGYINYSYHHADGTIISPIFQESIPPGDYYIAYKGRMLHTALTPMDFGLILRQPDYTDTDLGVLPPGETISLNGPIGEPDRKIRYTFKFDEATIGKGVWFIRGPTRLKVELFDGAGNLIPGGSIIPEDPTETYTLVLTLENGPPSAGNIGGRAMVVFSD